MHMHKTPPMSATLQPTIALIVASTRATIHVDLEKIENIDDCFSEYGDDSDSESELDSISDDDYEYDSDDNEYEYESLELKQKN